MKYGNQNTIIKLWANCMVNQKYISAKRIKDKVNIGIQRKKRNKNNVKKYGHFFKNRQNSVLYRNSNL